MSLEKLRSIIIQYCDLVGLEQPSLTSNGYPIVIDDVSFSIEYDDEETSENVFIYADFGEFPGSNKHEIKRLILKTNATLYATQGACLTRSANNNHIIFAMNVGLENLSAEIFRDILENLKQEAQNWRANTINDWRYLIELESN